MKQSVLIILYFTLINFTYSQKKFEIEYRNGWLYFDKYGSSANMGHISGYGLQSEIIFWMSKKIDKKFSYRLGCGYNNLWFLGVSGNPREISSYISLQAGMKYDIVPDKFGAFINVNSNVLLNGKPDFYVIYDEKRIYTNVDVGLQFKIGKRASLSISSPITIFPLYKEDGISNFEPIPPPPYDIWVETTGFNIGVKWTLCKIH